MRVQELREFIGNPEAYAVQQDDGSYIPVRQALGPGLLAAHLNAKLTIGTYVNVGSTARFICFDVDTGDDAKAQAARVSLALREMGVDGRHVGIEFSGRKGYHVWLTLNDFLEASELRSLGRAVLALAEVECEVFPKQDVARDLGNLVKLPGGKHRVSGMASEWVGPVPIPMPLARWTEDIVPNLPVEFRGRVGGGASERFPCMDIIQAEGCQPLHRRDITRDDSAQQDQTLSEILPADHIPDPPLKARIAIENDASPISVLNATTCIYGDGKGKPPGYPICKVYGSVPAARPFTS